GPERPAARVGLVLSVSHHGSVVSVDGFQVSLSRAQIAQSLLVLALGPLDFLQHLCRVHGSSASASAFAAASNSLSVTPSSAATSAFVPLATRAAASSIA